MELLINKRDITIPEEVIWKWQSIVNIMAELIDVPAALIMKVDPPYIEVFRSSESSKNPYKVGGGEHLTGLYCEQVIKTRSKLLVPNALKDKHWDKNPDIKLGMISYLGFPLLWPDDEVFGTICVLDLKENPYSKAYEQLMLQFKELVEAHLGLLYDREHLEDLVEQRTTGLKKAAEELQQGITERKKAEEALRQTAQEWGTTFESITDMVSIHDKNFKIVRANKPLTDTFNMKPKEIIGKNCYELMHGTKEPPSFCPHKQALETGKPHCTEVFEPHLGIYIEVSVSPIFDENGRTIATAHIVKDITERKRAEEQIWRKTAVVEAINNVFQETLVCETEEQVAYTCINMAEELTGSKYGLIGEVNEAGRFDTISYGDLGWAICKMPESEAISLSKNMELRGIWAQAILKEKSQIVNNPTSHPDSVGTPEGHPPITSFLGVPLKHAGKTIGMIGLANKEGGYGPADQEAIESLSVAFVEALHRKRAEQDLKNLNKELQATVEKLTLANRELQHFAHIAAHDLKAPLRAIGTLADWISTDYADKFDEEGKREVELLVGRVARMSDMIDSILRYSEAGRVIKEKEKVNLNALIEEVMAGIAPPENISVTVENELPVLEGEKIHFMQVFQNLLGNAVKYMDKPIGQIKVGCTEENGFWKFSVADNGPGVEKEYFEKIFEMFQTLLPRDEFETTGIGLSIVKKIVETYGGRVWVESEVGKGSVFFFTLPNQEMKVADDAKLKANIVS